MALGETTSPELERIAKQVVDAAYQVYRELGPGLLESVYETCLFHELTQRGLKARRQVAVPIRYRGITLESGLTLDLLVEEQIIIELKAVETLHPVFDAQLITYLRLSGKRLGFLINFNVPVFKEGIRRLIN
jgi:GxxExxY protein